MRQRSLKRERAILRE